MQHGIDPFTSGTNPLRYLFGKTWHYSAGNRHKIVWYWIMFLIANTISLAIYPLAMRKIVDVIQTGGITTRNIDTLLELLAVTFATQMVFWALHGPARVLERDNAFKARSNYRKYLLKGVLILPMEWHTEHHSGDTIDRVEKGASGLYDFSSDSFEVLYAAVQLIISYGMLAYFSRSAIYIVLGMTLVTAWITMQFDRVLVGQYRKLNRAENNVSESVFDAISNITTISILRSEEQEFEAIARKVDEPFDLFKRNTRLNEKKWFLMSVCCNLTTVLVLGFYFWHNIGAPQGVLLGNVYILMQYLGKISETFARFAVMYSNLLQRRAKVMNAEELARDFRVENFGNHVLPANWQKLQIAGLNFSYHTEEGAELHLNNVSLTIARGERIALVGHSGGGKTTLLQVMRDSRHPQSIVLSVDGMPIPQGFEGIARDLTLVPQETEMFAKSVRGNVTLGAEYDMEVIREFTDMACITDVIDRLPRGFDSLMKEKGVTLSGGQKQRLALARGLLACRKKSIVLLDEPVSNVDSRKARQIHENIFQAFSGKTIIESTHSLHLLPMFDRVIFMNDGQITASGTVDELLVTCPEFQALCQAYSEPPEAAVA